MSITSGDVECSRFLGLGLLVISNVKNGLGMCVSV